MHAQIEAYYRPGVAVLMWAVVIYDKIDHVWTEAIFRDKRETINYRDSHLIRDRMKHLYELGFDKKEE